MAFDPGIINQPQVEWKQPQEKLDRGVDFTDRLSGETSITLLSVTAVDTADGSDATAAIISSNPPPLVLPGTKTVQFRMQGGTTGKVYKVSVRAQGASGQVAEFDLELNVHEF
ncbi:MAG: hypothetical protein C4523_12695 [Myxococcales bacterium]|nr:MAG: hypothetical protein C4523_12695 [Myxococcales bacterium]